MHLMSVIVFLSAFICKTKWWTCGCTVYKVNEYLLRGSRHVSVVHVNMHARMPVIFKCQQLLTSSPNPVFHKHHAF